MSCSPQFTDAELADERWLPVPGFVDYEVSDLGRVRSLKFGRIRVLKAEGNGCGYLICNLMRDGKPVRRTPHSLVLEAFVGPRPDGMEVRHFPDHSRSNNRLSNLSWGTREQNGEDRIHNGTRKITPEARRDILESKERVVELARKHGVCVSYIYALRSRVSP